MVDSGAGTTVIGPEDAKSVRASQPDPKRTYKLADGSIIQNRGMKAFNAVKEEGDARNINAAVTDVDKPLLSVSQIVLSGATVVFSPKGSYIDSPGGRIVLVELQGNIYTMKMWVPNDQEKPFRGQA